MNHVRCCFLLEDDAEPDDPAFFCCLFVVCAKTRVSKNEQTKRKKNKKMHTDFWKDLRGEAAVGEYLLSNLWR